MTQPKPQWIRSLDIYVRAAGLSLPLVLGWVLAMELRMQKLELEMESRPPKWLTDSVTRIEIGQQRLEDRQRELEKIMITIQKRIPETE